MHRRTAGAGFLALVVLAFAAAPAAAAEPGAASIRAAREYVKGRAGVSSLAVIDSRGRLHGHAPGRTFVAASTVKAMILVAYLRRVRGRGVSRSERRALAAMIQRSENDAATALYRRVGPGGLRRLAARARLRAFSVEGEAGPGPNSAPRTGRGS